MLEPLGRNPWNRVVDLSWSLSSLKGWATLVLHRLEELRVDWLLQVGCLFCDYSVLETKDLGLVIASDLGVSILVARQERQLVWELFSGFHD